MAKKKERKFRAWYTHSLFVLTLTKIKKLAKDHDIELADPENPTQDELREVYKATFEEMSDPWEVTANGDCQVKEITDNKKSTGG